MVGLFCVCLRVLCAERSLQPFRGVCEVRKGRQNRYVLSIPRGRVEEDVRPFDFRQWRSIKGLTVPGRTLEKALTCQ